MCALAHPASLPRPLLPSGRERAGRVARLTALALAAAALLRWASPPVALAAGILFARLIGQPLARWHHQATKWLLQGSVVLLGFGMTLPAVLRSGADGSLFAAATIGATLLLGRWLGRRLKLGANTSLLISAGTAICGGSAVAAVSSVIGASEAEIAVSIGTIFLLNAVALYVFPVVGHLLHLNPSQFGLWAGVAIHDISSVVGAGLTYGRGSLPTALAVKLSRTLWIVPVTLAIALRARRRAGAEGASRPRGFPVPVPAFIALFLLASVLRSYVPGMEAWAPLLSAIARHGMSLVLFQIGTSLSAHALRVVGWRTAAAGLALWLFVSAGSLGAIIGFRLRP